MPVWWVNPNLHIPTWVRLPWIKSAIDRGREPPVNRLLIPYLLDAVRAFESGTGSKEDIDQAMKLGTNHPMGPLELSDLIGLDTMLNIATQMFGEFKDPVYAPPPVLKRMVLAGHLGRKTGKGFYGY